MAYTQSPVSYINADEPEEKLPTALAYTPSERDRKLVSLVERRFQDKEFFKRAYEKTWFVNHAFVVGQHYISFNDVTRTLEIPWRPNWRQRYTANYIGQYLKRNVSQLTRSKPILWVEPATIDAEDIKRSEVSTAALEYVWNQQGMSNKIKSLVSWGLETGTAFLYIGWDPMQGKELDISPKEEEEGEPYGTGGTTEEESSSVSSWGNPAHKPNEEGDKLPYYDERWEDIEKQKPPKGTSIEELIAKEEKMPLYQGEISVSVLNSFEIEVDPIAMNFEDAGWVMINRYRPLKWVRQNYENGIYVTGEQMDKRDYYEHRMREMVGIWGYATEMSPASERVELSLIHEMWEAPSRDFPNGRLIVVGGGVLLYAGPNPYKHHKFPLVDFTENVINGRIWGQATIEQMIPQQKDYNKARSQDIEMRNLMLKYKVLNPRTSHLRSMQWDSEPGEVVDYNPGPRGEKPEILGFPPMSALRGETEDRTLKDMQEVAAYHEVSRGVVPPNLKSGVAISYLQEQDTASMGATADNLENCLIRAGQRILWLIHQFYDEERLIKIVGKNGELKQYNVRGDDLIGRNPKADYFDLRIQKSSLLPKSQFAQRQEVADYIHMGLIDPHDPKQREKIMKAFSLFDARHIPDEQRTDELFAQKENEDLKRGQIRHARMFDDHEVHLQELHLYMKTLEFDQLPLEIKNYFLAHEKEHEFLMMKRMMQAQQMMGGGAPPPMPPPPISGKRGQRMVQRPTKTLSATHPNNPPVMQNASQIGANMASARR